MYRSSNIRMFPCVNKCAYIFLIYVPREPVLHFLSEQYGVFQFQRSCHTTGATFPTTHFLFACLYLVMRYCLISHLCWLFPPRVNNVASCSSSSLFLPKQPLLVHPSLFTSLSSRASSQPRGGSARPFMTTISQELLFILGTVAP